MPVMTSAGKHASDVKRGKTRHWCQARENTPVMSSAGKHASDVKRGKTCQWCQAPENIPLMSNAEKHASDVKRLKICHWCQTRENMPAMPSAGKYATDVKRGKTCRRCQVRENMPLTSTAGKHACHYCWSGLEGAGVQGNAFPLYRDIPYLGITSFSLAHMVRPDCNALSAWTIQLNASTAVPFIKISIWKTTIQIFNR